MSLEETLKRHLTQMSYCFGRQAAQGLKTGSQEKSLLNKHMESGSRSEMTFEGILFRRRDNRYDKEIARKLTRTSWTSSSVESSPESSDLQQKSNSVSIIFSVDSSQLDSQ